MLHNQSNIVCTLNKLESKYLKSIDNNNIEEHLNCRLCIAEIYFLKYFLGEPDCSKKALEYFLDYINTASKENHPGREKALAYQSYLNECQNEQGSESDKIKLKNLFYTGQLWFELAKNSELSTDDKCFLLNKALPFYRNLKELLVNPEYTNADPGFFKQETINSIDTIYNKIKSELDQIAKGNNALHIIVNNGTFEQIQSFIENYPDKKELTRLALSLNNQGLLPINLICQTKTLNKYESTDVRILLQEIMNKRQIKPLKELVDFQEICNQFSIIPDSVHYKTIRDACIVVNEIRKKVVHSETHPNGPPDTTLQFEGGAIQSDLKRKKNQLMRELGDYLNNNFFIKENNDHYRLITDDDETYIAILYYIGKPKCKELLAKVTRASNAGLVRCSDMAYDAHNVFSRLQKNKPLQERLHGEVICLRPGDHGFYLAGRDLATDFKNQENWQGEGLTVIDAWSGYIFPVSKETVKEYLCDYREVRGSRYLLHFNSAYHKFENPLLNIHPDHFHIVYISKDTAKDEQAWKKFLQSCKDNESRYLPPEKILSKYEWDSHRQLLPGPVTSFHYPIDPTIPVDKQEWNFIRLFVEMEFADKPAMNIQKTDYFKEAKTSTTKAKLSKFYFHKAAQLFQNPPPSAINSNQTLIEKQNNPDKFAAKLEETGSNANLAFH